MRISSKRLRSLAAGVDDQHREAMVDFRDRIGEVHVPTGRSRRRFLTDLGLGSATIALGPTLVPALRLLPAGAQEEGLTDDDITTFSASVEKAAVVAYDAVIESGLLSGGEVLSTASLFRDHHEEHGQAFESLSSSDPEANQGVLDVFAPMIEAASDQAAALTVALALEEGAAATYLFALGILGPAAAAATATILPVEGQHAVVLGYALDLEPGEYLPALQTVGGALDPAAFPPE